MNIKEFPNDRYRFQFYINADKLTGEQIKAKTGCYAYINLAYFDMDKYTKAGTPQEVYASTESALVVNGYVIGKVIYHEWGVCVDDSGKLFMGLENQKNYAVGVPPQIIDGKRYASARDYPKDGCSYIGFKADGTPVFLLAVKDEPMTSDEVIAALKKAGCIHILRYDGSWSSQGDFGDGPIKPSQQRIVQSYLLVFERQVKPEQGKKLICLDPGHGSNSVNASPDKSYYEHEFALDMAKRIKPLLEQHGVNALLTRNDGSNPSLTQRCDIANSAKAELFVSLHSNAAGNGGWYDASGLCVYTYKPGGERDRAANLLLDRMQEAGVKLFGSKLYHADFTVLAKTNMPAYLIEYGFHTSKSDVELLKNPTYRDRLATATAKAILDWFGIALQENSYVRVGPMSKSEAESIKSEMTAKGYTAVIE